jgi:hypothetical protein
VEPSFGGYPPISEKLDTSSMPIHIFCKKRKFLDECVKKALLAAIDGGYLSALSELYE